MVNSPVKVRQLGEKQLDATENQHLRHLWQL